MTYFSEMNWTFLLEMNLLAHFNMAFLHLQIETCTCLLKPYSTKFHIFGTHSSSQMNIKTLYPLLINIIHLSDKCTTLRSISRLLREVIHLKSAFFSILIHYLYSTVIIHANVKEIFI